MKQAYIYPISGRDNHLGLHNPYINDFINYFGKDLVFVNRNNPSNSGILDIIKYLFKIDFIFLNWIENIPERKAGILQTILLILLLPSTKILGIKIIWTMHNKLSHSKEKHYLKKLIFKKMLKYSDIILTHSSEGIIYGEEMLTGSRIKIHYYPHPIKDRRLSSHMAKKYDLIIWGTISPYKGIDKFLEYIHFNKLEKKYKILIIGKITTNEYSEKLEKFKSENIFIENKFIEDSLLQELIAMSKLVLFTYSQSSILSSGVLMDSLGYGANIIGPDTGGFADLEKEGIIKSYADFHDMFMIIDEQLSDYNTLIPKEKLDKFLVDNSWDKFAENISRILNPID